MRTETRSDHALDPWVIDELIECYVSWREECHAVHQAYELWVDSTRALEWLTYARYVAALDREERAARAYADHIGRFDWISDDSAANSWIRSQSEDNQ
ncbi:MAG TPA: hypothetical protein VHV75_15900 [Solirubrobacteraceae bacterium]|jgi:hypothetical protein|nr:hypothetical protein [Solirubrobacteraceae bacterium]